MDERKIYKVNERQLKVIVESQKSSPQLQTEVLDSLGGMFLGLLTSTFKRTSQAFKYFAGIGVNVYYDDRFTSSGKFPIKKNNPLAPLSIYKSELSGLPQNYQNLFKTIYGDMDKVQQNKNIIDQLKFDSVNGIVYPIKFQFQNLKKEAKENSSLMMTTWSLVFNVVSSGRAIDNNEMKFELVKFISQGPAISQFLSQASKNKNDQDILNVISQYASAQMSSNELIFNSQSEANRFKQAMKNQIDEHMKVIIGLVNAKMGVNQVIKIPTVTVDVSPNLVGDSNIQPQNKKPNITIQQLDTDINEIQRQINLYTGQDQYKDYIKDLQFMLNKLSLMKVQLQKS